MDIRRRRRSDKDNLLISGEVYPDVIALVNDYASLRRTKMPRSAKQERKTTRIVAGFLREALPASIEALKQVVKESVTPQSQSQG